MLTLSMTTDYRRGVGDPSPYLRRIAAAGFTHVHWCHQWNTDFLYDLVEVEQIERWLHETGLRLLNVHGSDGPEKCWYSPEEYRRQAGVALVRNRLELAARLGGTVVIMHTGEPEGDVPGPNWAPLCRSLDALEPDARTLGVRIAVENGSEPGSWRTIERLLAAYSPDFVGLCYDSGHGNIGDTGLGPLSRLAARLIAVHLHDNDGIADQHRPPFTGTVDWPRLAAILARSPYRREPVNIETVMSSADGDDEHSYLAGVRSAAVRLHELIGAAATPDSSPVLM
jgi:sugar phosphate isomerase/epimerase